MLKYFSSVVEEPISTGGAKLIHDMQKTIKDFLASRKITYHEYSYGNLKRALLNMVLPTPYGKYLMFGYLGNPFLTPPLVVVYCFLFCLITLKKKLAREKFYIIVVDLLELQSVLWINKKGRMTRIFKIFGIFLERMLLSHVADEIVSLVDKEFVISHYRAKRVHEIEFLEYRTSSRSDSTTRTRTTKILYAGDLGSRIGFSLEFFEDILRNLGDSCELLLVSRGLERHVQEKLNTYHSLRNLGEQEVEKLDNIAKECRFGLILYSPDYLYYNIIPSIKLSFYIANGLTIISTNLERTRKLNDKYNFGYVLDKEEILEFVKDLSLSRIKRNATLECQIAKGEFLHKALDELDFG